MSTLEHRLRQLVATVLTALDSELVPTRRIDADDAVFYRLLPLESCEEEREEQGALEESLDGIRLPCNCCYF